MIRFASPGYIAAGGTLVRALLGFYGVFAGFDKEFSGLRHQVAVFTALSLGLQGIKAEVVQGFGFRDV